MEIKSKNKVIISNEQKKVKIPSGIRLLVRKCCIATLKLEQFDKNCEISVTFVDNPQIQVLNREYRNKDIETDVLSFPLMEDGKYDINHETGNVVLGDIVISLEKAAAQAESYGHSFQREVGFLTVHSMLHLLGYDHEEGGLEAARMREKEEDIMTRLGHSRGASYVMRND